MKGQMFLIMAIIIVVILTILKISLGLTQIIENKRYMESGLETQQFQNIKDEVIKTIETSYYQNAEITENVENFLKFVRSYLLEEAMDLNGFVVESIHPNVSVGEDTKLNVTVINLLGTELLSLSLTFNSTKNFSFIDDEEKVQTDFIFNTDLDANYTLSVFYLTSYGNETNNITIPVEIGKSKFIGLFDLRLISPRIELRDKFTRAYTFP